MPDGVEMRAPGETAGNGHARREMLPSARELELGLAEPVEDPGAAVPERAAQAREPVRARFRGAFRQYVRDADPRKIHGPKMPLVILGATALLGTWDNSAIGLFGPEIIAEFNIDLQFLVTLGSVTGIIVTLLSPFMGYLADRVKRVWMVRIGSIVSNASSIAQGLAPGIPALVGARLVDGTAGAVSGPASLPLVADYFAVHSRARVYAFLGLTGGLGAIAGQVLSGNLGETLGWRTAVVILGIIATVVSLGTFWLTEPKRGYQDRLAMGATEEVAAREQKPVTWAEAWRGAASITTVRRLWYAVPFQHMSGVVLFFTIGLYYAQEFGLGPRARANIAVAGTVVGVIGLVLGGPMADRLLAYKPGRVTQWIAGLQLLNALSIVILVLSGNLWLSIVFNLPIALFTSILNPARAALFSLTIPARLRGLGMQTFAPWNLIGLASAPFVAGMVDGLGVRSGLLVFVPFAVIAAAFTWASGLGVEHDIRNALAASMADEDAARARREGQGKMVVARDVDVHYDGVQVLFGVDLDVYEGEILALLGTNGAGKSTLLRAISGLTEPSAGAVVIDGRDTTHLPPHQIATLGIAQMPGGRGVFPGLTIDENLRAAAWLARREDADEIEAEITRLTTEMFPALRERMSQAAGTLSGGEQQMVAIAQAFLMRPRLLMIDELSLGLAPGIVRQLLEALRALRDRGTTIILVEQSVNLALTVADRAVFMEKGEVRFTGPTADLLERRDLVRSVLLRGPGAGRAHRVARARTAAAPTGTSILEVRDVRVSFGGVDALRGVSLDVAPGEILGIIGPNGAGKTTLFDVISGFVRPDGGTVAIGGKDVTGLAPDERVRAGLGRSFQDSRLFPAMTVRENVLVALERHLSARSAITAALWLPGVRRSEVRAARRADLLIEMIGLGDYRDKLAGELSTGVRRLCDLALQLAADPDVLLLDEPSSGIAQAETVELGALLQRVRREANCALLVIEHDMDLIAGISDRLLAMDLGTVVTEGKPDDVLADERVVGAYIGGADVPAPSRKDRR